MTIEETGESRKLRECPFCGCTDMKIYRVLECVNSNITFEFGSKIKCMGCLMTVYQEGARNVDDNVEAWNRRTDNEYFINTTAL